MGFVTVIAQHLNVADVYCKLMPHLHPFISQPIIQVTPPSLSSASSLFSSFSLLQLPIVFLVFLSFFIPLLLLLLLQQIDKELVLLSVLKEPVSRSIFDYALRSKDIASLFRHLLLRQKKRAGSIPECPAPDDPAIAQLLKKLLSQVRGPIERLFSPMVPPPSCQSPSTRGVRGCSIIYQQGAAEQQQQLDRVSQ